MKKWYKESYFDRKNWLLENFDKLNISNDELVLLLLIDLCKDSNKNITYDYLIEKLNKNSKEIDKLFANLVSKNYLTISTNSKGLVIDIDNIFEFDPSKYEISENTDLYETIGEVFGKPLIPMELEKVNELLNTYSKADILQAVRIAEANRKFKLSYVEGILRNAK